MSGHLPIKLLQPGKTSFRRSQGSLYSSKRRASQYMHTKITVHDWCLLLAAAAPSPPSPLLPPPPRMRTHIQTAAMPGGEHTVVNVEPALLFLGYIVGTVTDPYSVRMRGKRGNRPMIHAMEMTVACQLLVVLYVYVMQCQYPICKRETEKRRRRDPWKGDVGAECGSRRT